MKKEDSKKFNSGGTDLFKMYSSIYYVKYTSSPYYDKTDILKEYASIILDMSGVIIDTGHAEKLLKEFRKE